MDNEISPDELGRQRCSDLEVPLFTSEIFEPVVALFLSDITNDQWVLADEEIDTGTTIELSYMCHELVEAISALVLEVVGPQVQSRMYGQTDLEGASSSSIKTIETPQINCNYHIVTEEDIQASLGNTFHSCFGAVLGVVQERSHDSEKLLELFGAEVKTRVNRSLDVIRWSISFQQPEESAELETSTASHTEDMVYFRILRCLIRKDKRESHEDKECQDNGLPEGSSPDEVKVTAEYAEIICSVSQQQRSDPSGCQSLKCSACPAEELPQRGKTFLAVFLGKLLDHIAHSTKTSILDVDFDRMLERLRERAVGEISATLPQTVGNTLIPIYKELCRKFGCARLLQAAMVSGDKVFEKAVARTLNAHLQKSTGRTSSFVTKVRTFFNRKTRRVTPACEINTSVSHSEVINLENGSTPQRKQEHPAIMKIFSSAATMLSKLFSSFISAGSQDY